MGRIQILDDQLTNQIAAGEVVERPASVVKELVENAIDAEATRIVIRVQEGGISSIQVSDNGIGMVREDAILAFSRHATSKLKKERDLFAIRSLGFRGEALPSIASIAHVTLTTAVDQQVGTRIKLEGGQQQEVEDISCAQGTDVLVEDLFFNTPARLKYLKTVNTEIGHIADIVGRMALAHPHISFLLRHHNRELLRTTGDGKLKHVIHAIYGRGVSSLLLPIQGENFDFRIQGYLTKPEMTRANRSYITLILNGRYIRSLPLTQTILRAYGTLLPVGRYPIAVLQIQMDPKLTDVNVHPTKLEVRLSKERECSDLIAQSVKQAFQGHVLIPHVHSQLKQKQTKSKTVQERFCFDQTTKSDSPTMVKEDKAEFVESKETEPTMEPQEEKIFKINEEIRMDDETEDKPKTAIEPDELLTAESTRKTTESKKSFPDLVPLSQIHGTYLVAQSEDGFYLIDQHAAHERIYYEVFYQKLASVHHQQQLLLVPITIECTVAEANILQSYLAELRSWGLEIEPFGGSTFLVRSYPNWFPEESAKELIDEVMNWMREHGKVETAVLRDNAAKMMSCKAAIKANRHLRQDEMDHLLHQLRSCSNPYTCPHGRPILVHFSKYELEKMFKRVM